MPLVRRPECSAGAVPVARVLAPFPIRASIPLPGLRRQILCLTVGAAGGKGRQRRPVTRVCIHGLIRGLNFLTRWGGRILTDRRDSRLVESAGFFCSCHSAEIVFLLIDAAV